MMAKAERISVALSATMADVVYDAVESGEYANAGEVIRDALRDWTMKRRVEMPDVDELRRLYQEGVDSGPGVDPEPTFARLREKYAKMAKK
ncbi:MAG TPA: type II toxin-antitoxin system ParD family antitoxin [Stellaceae bacterium]|nr:type II toxin-antitoxin system ParD family antitoxin [Stellaceae bacterium]